MKGSLRMGFGLAVLIGAGAVSGPIAADPTPADTQAPDPALLEYLGGLVNDDDRWVGPDDMQGALDARDRDVFPDDGPATAEVIP